MRFWIIVLAVLFTSNCLAQSPPSKEWINSSAEQWSQLSPAEIYCIDANLPEHNVQRYINLGILPNHEDIVKARRLGYCYFAHTKKPVSVLEKASIEDDGLTPDQRRNRNILYFTLGAGIAIYFLPTLIAIIRGHPSWGGIFALNIFLGWTFLGWVGALIWSGCAKRYQVIILNGTNSTKIC